MKQVIIQELEYPSRLDPELVEKWADGIPIFSENDPHNPEWRSTPTVQVDLTKEGYGVVHIKDESDRKSNPTGTIKDRPGWELTTLYRDNGRGIYLRQKAGLVEPQQLPVPRLTYVTAGNVGRSVSAMFEKYGLPPIKLLIDSGISKEKLEAMKKLYADIYMADLSQKPLTPEEIKKLTNNENGVDITSVMTLEPHAVFYDWHVHEAFNEDSDEVYVPYGSGRIMENYLTWQARNARNQDPRLKISLARLLNMSILGAQPEQAQSIADKLGVDHNPFALYSENDTSALRTLGFTGKHTGVYKISEERIKQAYGIMKQHVDCEPSACAGLALYLQRFDQGEVSKGGKVLIVNTGKGI